MWYIRGSTVPTNWLTNQMWQTHSYKLYIHTVLLLVYCTSYHAWYLRNNSLAPYKIIYTIHVLTYQYVHTVCTITIVSPSWGILPLFWEFHHHRIKHGESLFQSDVLVLVISWDHMTIYMVTDAHFWNEADNQVFGHWISFFLLSALLSPIQLYLLSTCNRC